MSRHYLEFEQPIKVLDEELVTLRLELERGSGTKDEVKRLEKRREEAIKKIFNKLNRWQRVQLARHPGRPYSKDFIERWSSDFLVLHGDRHFADDTAVITGMGTIKD